ncbi:hypothetical protein MiSe_49860 [Microseira wollei NIES-4236]|uniref:Uncharacterized protein n=1 Tax=Microseira wollei NIES-4236 TaxID=2530354 RepID=A0AAV3XCD0_9CYAN|nr:hypothetical protein MiSe_49860 [Microseira wollei NIES-4236]
MIVKQLDFSLKRTAGEHQFTQSVGDKRVLYFNRIKLLTDGMQSSRYQSNETVLTHRFCTCNLSERASDKIQLLMAVFWENSPQNQQRVTAGQMKSLPHIEELVEALASRVSLSLTESGRTTIHLPVLASR